MKEPETQENSPEAKPALAEAPGSADFDGYPDEYWDDEETCEMCGGDGVIEYLDHPEVWGEDCPSYQNHLLPCPECRRRELAEGGASGEADCVTHNSTRRKANPPNACVSHAGLTTHK